MKPATRELIQKDQVLALIRSAQAGTHSLKTRRSGMRELYEARSEERRVGKEC